MGLRVLGSVYTHCRVSASFNRTSTHFIAVHMLVLVVWLQFRDIKTPAPLPQLTHTPFPTIRKLQQKQRAHKSQWSMTTTMMISQGGFALVDASSESMHICVLNVHPLLPSPTTPSRVVADAASFSPEKKKNDLVVLLFRAD